MQICPCRVGPLYYCNPSLLELLPPVLHDSNWFSLLSQINLPGHESNHVNIFLRNPKWFLFAVGGSLISGRCLSAGNIYICISLPLPSILISWKFVNSDSGHQLIEFKIIKILMTCMECMFNLIFYLVNSSIKFLYSLCLLRCNTFFPFFTSCFSACMMLPEFLPSPLNAMKDEIQHLCGSFHELTPYRKNSQLT